MNKRGLANALAVLALLSIVLIVSGAIFLGDADITGFSIADPVDNMSETNTSTLNATESTAPQPMSEPGENLTEEEVILDDIIEEPVEEIVEEQIEDTHVIEVIEELPEELIEELPEVIVEIEEPIIKSAKYKESEEEYGIKATSISSCGYDIINPGDYVLEDNLVSCPSYGIAIHVPDVNLDCDGFNLTGQGVLGGIFMNSLGVESVHISGDCKISGFMYGIYAGNVDGLIIEDVFINGSTTYGVYSTSTSTDITVRDTEINKSVSYNYYFGSENVTLRGVKSYSGGQGIYFSKDGATISDVEIYDSDGRGLTVHNADINNVIIDNATDNCLSLYAADNTVIGPNIYLSNCETDGSSTAISGAISMRYSDSVLLNGVHINNSCGGIQLGGSSSPSSDVRITNSDIRNTSCGVGYSIRVFEGSDDFEISDTTISDSKHVTGNFMEIIGDNAIIGPDVYMNNLQRTLASEGYAIRIRGDSAVVHDVFMSEIGGSEAGDDRGITLYGSEGSLIENNTISSEYTAIEVRDNSNNNTIRNNILNSSFGSINFWVDCGDNNVSGNSFYTGPLEDYGTGNDFCADEIGNFYKLGVSKPASECNPEIINPIGTEHASCSSPTNINCTYFGSQQDMNITWDATGGADPILYEVLWSGDSGTSWNYELLSEYNTTNLFSQWDVDALAEGSEYNISVTPISQSAIFGDVYGIPLSTGLFSIDDNDLDDDGYANESYPDGDDCDDSDNETNPGADELCADSDERRNIDANCNGWTGWADTDCLATFIADGSGFFPGTNGTTDWNIYDSDDVTLTLNNSYGRIEWFDKVNIADVDLNKVKITENSVSVDSSMTNLNQPAEIELYGLSYIRSPYVYKDGALCLPPECNVIDYTGGKVVFNVTGFSNYTTTPNSILYIYDEGDPEGGSKTLETYHEVIITANYTNITGSPINNDTGPGVSVNHGGTCNITIDFEAGPTVLDKGSMGFDEDTGLYTILASPQNFTESGTYNYSITCGAIEYEATTSTDDLIVITDITDPAKPTLYKQIWMYPTNITTDNETQVYGFFGEPYINISASVRSDYHFYEYNLSTNYSEGDSLLGGDSLTISEYCYEGENQTFLNWSAETEEVLKTYRYIEFLNHNKTGFLRYEIEDSVQLGEEILVELNQSLESDIPVGTRTNFHNSQHPAGWFNFSVPLMGGSNKIQVWGADLAGNEGLASIDYINYPYGIDVPPEPVIWALPEAVNTNLTIVGWIDRLIMTGTNTTIVSRNDTLYNYSVWNDTIFNSTEHIATAVVSQDAPANNPYVFINGSDAQLFANTSLYVGFANHNRSYWLFYDILTNSSPIPGEDLRIYLGPNLSTTTLKGTEIYLYNDSRPTGWFNVTYDEDYLFESLTNEIYAVARDNNGEGPKSDSQFVYYDIIAPEFITANENYTDWLFFNMMPVEKTYNLVDDYKLDLSEHMISWDDGTNRSWYFTDEAWVIYDNSTNLRDKLISEGFDVSNDTISNNSISCSGSISNESCTVYFNLSDTFETENGFYNITVYTSDIATNENITTLRSVFVQADGLKIANLTDAGDITAWPKLNATWDLDGDETKLSHYQVAIGTAPYPDSNFNANMEWFNISDVAWVEVTDDNMSFTTSEVYYITVRAVAISGNIGTPNSTDGILFIDSTPPVCNGDCVYDNGLWTNKDDRLFVGFNFTDDESDVVMYEYTIGTTCYPTEGYDTITGMTQTSENNFTVYGLTLEDNMTYMTSARARNGNLAEGYNGTWSAWNCSDNITVDTTPPEGAWIDYATGNTTAYNITINYSSGYDNYSGLADTYLLVATAPLGIGLDNACGMFSGYDIAQQISTGDYGVIYNITNGTCYSFKILVYDVAGNSEQFGSSNYSMRVRTDNTDPTDILSITDDGFYTYTPFELHALWTPSDDPETGISVYNVTIRGKEIGDTSCDATNCSEIVSVLEPNPEVLISNMDLMHNWKYYFDIFPINGFNMNGSHSYSDGIIYIDIIIPEPVNITSVNNDTTNYYETNTNNITINFTGEANLTCVLTFEDRDFDDTAQQCGQIAGQEGNYSCFNITTGRYTNTDEISDDGQGFFTWYISCQDEAGNYQDLDHNTHVTFEVDWPNDPIVEDMLIYAGELDEVSDDLTDGFVTTLALTSDYDGANYTFNISAFSVDDVTGTADIVVNTSLNQSVYNDTPVNSIITFSDGSSSLAFRVVAITGSMVDLSYYNTEIFIDSVTSDMVRCIAEIFDDDNDYGENQLEGVNMSFMIESTQADEHDNVTPMTSVGQKSYLYRVPLEEHDTATRDKIITCNLSAFDGEHHINSSVTNTVLNSRPAAPDISSFDPEDSVINDNYTFSWGAATDADGDYLTYTIEVDNETDFDYSELSVIEANDVEAVDTSLEHNNPDVYGDVIVYQDRRLGNEDIYIYNISTGIETQLTATASVDEEFPKVYGNYILYVIGDSLKLYTISSATESTIGSINITSDQGFYYDMWDGLLVYSVVGTSDVYLRDLSDGSEFTISDIVNVDNKVAIYGNAVIISNNSLNSYIYDILSNKTSLFSSSYSGAPSIFGEYVVFTSGTSYQLMDLSSRTALDSDGAEQVALYGSRLLYYDDTAGDDLWSYLIPKDAVSGLGDSAGFVTMYKDLLAHINSSGTIRYAFDGTPFPALYSTYGTSTDYMINTENSDSAPDTELYYWRLKVCDSTISNNSCAYSSYESFVVDNIAPNITVENPAEDVTVSGIVTLLTTITDNYYDQDDLEANYTVYYENGTIFDQDVLLETDFDAEIDFIVLEGVTNDTINFSIEIYAKDPLGNVNMFTRNISVNPNAPYFNFSTFNDNSVAVDDEIDDTFTAYSVMNSSISISGPYPDTTIRHYSSRTNISMTDHSYEATIDTSGWDEGKYILKMTGSNPVEADAEEERYFFVDHADPVLIANMTLYYDTDAEATTLYANDTVYFNVQYNDTTIQRIIIDYINSTDNASHIDDDYITADWTGGVQTVNTKSDPVNLSIFINTTYCWNSTATDNLTYSNSSENCFDVLNNPPYQTSTITINPWPEDVNYTPYDLTKRFTDVNMILGDILTYNCTSSANVTSHVNATSGILILEPDSNWFGVQSITCTATDMYGDSETSDTISLSVTPVNDDPVIGAIPQHVVAEDSPEASIDLTLWFTDYDVWYGAENMTWTIVDDGDLGIANYTMTKIDELNSSLTITPIANKTGVDAITLRITDAEGAYNESDVSINITPVNDVPFGFYITYPVVGIYMNGLIDIVWNAASDTENDEINYSLEYSLDGGSWMLINDSISNPYYMDWDASGLFGNVSLRLNASDWQNSSSYVHGNFTVDNVAPEMSGMYPIHDQVISDATPTLLLTTNETSNCTATIADVGTIGTSYLNTTHQIPVSAGDSLDNGTYNLTWTCTDLAGNAATTSLLFKKRDDDITFVGYTVNPPVQYVGQDVNVTLRFETIGKLITINIDIYNETGLWDDFDISVFNTVSNETYEYSEIVQSYTSIGNHSIFIDTVTCGGCTAFEDYWLNDTFAIYELGNQTINLNE